MSQLREAVDFPLARQYPRFALDFPLITRSHIPSLLPLSRSPNTPAHTHRARRAQNAMDIDAMLLGLAEGSAAAPSHSGDAGGGGAGGGGGGKKRKRQQMRESSESACVSPVALGWCAGV